MSNSAPFTITINPAAGLPSWRVGQAVGEWRQIAGTAPNTSAMPAAAIFAWTGMSLDRRDDTIYMVANGGHNDTFDNGVYSIRMSLDNPTWQTRRASTGADGGAWDEVDYYPDGSPTSAHTYSHQQFIAQRNRAMRFGAGSRHGPSGSAGTAVDGFNILTNQFDPAGTYPRAPNHGGANVAWTSCQDYSTGDVYMNYADAGGGAGGRRAARWNQASNTFTALAQPPYGYYGYYMPAAFDHTRRRYLILGGQEAGGRAVYTVASNTWATGGSISGALNDGHRGGMEYVEALDAYVLRNNTSGGAVVVINAGTFAAQAFSTTGGASIPSVDAVGNGNGVFNKWQYSPNLGGIFYIGNYTAGIWFLRLH